MKKPPSASASPPIHTTQRVPSVSSKPGSGCGNGGGGADGPPAVSCAASAGVVLAGATDSTSGTIGGGSATIFGAAGVEVCSKAWVDGSGGGGGRRTNI